MHSRFLAAAFIVAFTAAATAQTAPARPKITGISHLAVYTSDPAATDHYYREIIGAAKLPDPENPLGVRYAFNATQFVEVLPLPPGAGINRLDHTAYNTSDAEGMRKYLSAKAWKTPAKVEKGADGSRWFTVLDPEGNKVEFVEPPRLPQEIAAPSVIGRHLMHIGIMVHSRAVEDTFYRDLLGFRPYWFGGMVESRLDWVSQQTPDSHDWLEYMLTSGPSGSGHHLAARPGRSRSSLNRRQFCRSGPQDARSRQPPYRGPRRAHPDRQRWQGPVQPLRPRRHSSGTDELPRQRKTLLLAVYRRRPGGMRQSELRKSKINRTFVMNGRTVSPGRCEGVPIPAHRDRGDLPTLRSAAKVFALRGLLICRFSARSGRQSWFRERPWFPAPGLVRAPCRCR